MVVQGQLGEVRDPLGPLHQGEELLVRGLADVGHRVIGLMHGDGDATGSAGRRGDPLKTPKNP